MAARLAGEGCFMIMAPVKSIGVVVPVYNEAEGLPDLFAALERLKVTLAGVRLRVVFVDDHSDDQTPSLLRAGCADSDWLSFARLSRRSGSHVAIIAGLTQCDEDCAAFIAADLQDPPELIPQMIELCEKGNDIVWATWTSTDDRSVLEDLASRTFHNLLLNLSNVGQLPYRASFALLSRRAYKHLVNHCDTRPSLVVEIPRIGYSVATVPFSKPRRKTGKSKWNVRRKILAFADAIVASSFLPLRAMVYFGMLVSAVGFAYALFLIVRALTETPKVTEGWTSLMVVVLVLSGIQMLMLGIIGEYVWRTREGTRRDRLFLVEDGENLRPEKDTTS